jgi:hypothetical protein
MTVKNKAKASLKQNAQTLTVVKEEGKSEHRKLAEIKLSSSVLNTLTTEAFTKSLIGEIDFTEAVAVMKEKTEKIVAGDLSELESTLTAQVVSLNAIFTSLARRSMNCEYLNQVETNLRLALKAQAQCARTVEVLAAMKNPPIIFAKQANIAHGHQQVNNGVQPATHAGKTIIAPERIIHDFMCFLYTYRTSAYLQKDSWINRSGSIILQTNY